MNSPEENRSEEFAERVGTALKVQAEELDGATRSRLNRARQFALAGQGKQSSLPDARRNWKPAGAMAMVALFVTVILVDGYQLGRPVGEQGATGLQSPVAGLTTTPSAGDLEVLMVDEDLALLHDIGFYNWLQSVPVSSGAASISTEFG